MAASIEEDPLPMKGSFEDNEKTMNLIFLGLDTLFKTYKLILYSMSSKSVPPTASKFYILLTQGKEAK